MATPTSHSSPTFSPAPPIIASNVRDILAATIDSRLDYVPFVFYAEFERLAAAYFVGAGTRTPSDVAARVLSTRASHADLIGTAESDVQRFERRITRIKEDRAVEREAIADREAEERALADDLTDIFCDSAACTALRDRQDELAEIERTLETIRAPDRDVVRALKRKRSRLLAGLESDDESAADAATDATDARSPVA